MVNLLALAMDKDGKCRIIPREVLVATPQNYNGNKCMRASQRLFWNIPTVYSLFQELNPLSLHRVSHDDSIDINNMDKPCKSQKIDDIISLDGIKLKYSEDYSTELSHNMEVKSIDTCNKRGGKALACTKRKVQDNSVDVTPQKKFINLQHLMTCTVRTFQKCEQSLTNLMQKQMFLENPKDTKTHARILIKGSRVIVIFFIELRMLVHALLATSCNVSIVASEPFDFIGFVEFTMFLSVLIWDQKQSYPERHSLEP